MRDPCPLQSHTMTVGKKCSAVPRKEESFWHSNIGVTRKSLLKIMGNVLTCLYIYLSMGSDNLTELRIRSPCLFVV